MTYLEKLQDPKWSMLRFRALAHYGRKCNECGTDNEQLQVHHRHYNLGWEPWDYPVEMLEILCEHCHERRERELIRWRKLVAYEHTGTVMAAAVLLEKLSGGRGLDSTIRKIAEWARNDGWQFKDGAKLTNPYDWLNKTLEQEEDRRRRFEGKEEVENAIS